jgi:acyl-CoA thioesterase-1
MHASPFTPSAIQVFRRFLQGAAALGCGAQPSRYGIAGHGINGKRPQRGRGRAFSWRRAAALTAGAVGLALSSLPLAGTAQPQESGAASSPKLRILALGDSLTAGYGLAPEDGFVAQLQRALDAAGLDVQVLDGGVSGDTTAGGLARLDWALADDPDAVILELGANDGLRGLDPAATRANLDAMLTRLGQAGKAVLLAGMLAPPNLGPEYGAEFNRIYPELAAAHGVTLYPFFLDGVAAEPSLNQDDGIHPNADGVRIIVERLMPRLRELITQARAGAAG